MKSEWDVVSQEFIIQTDRGFLCKSMFSLIILYMSYRQVLKIEIKNERETQICISIRDLFLRDNVSKYSPNIVWRIYQLRDNDRQTIQSRFAGSVYQQEIEENLLDFLRFAEEDLPVYCTPGKLRELYLDIENSPLYTNF